RGKQAGGELSDAEFERVRLGLQSWIGGKPFQDIEIALGVEPTKVRHCSRSRDLVLKVVNRRLYMIAAAVAELAKGKHTELGVPDPFPALLESLAFALRSGFDTPE